LWPQLVEQLRLDVLGATLLAVLLGGAVGLERELRGKAAGLRTNILICVGATLFTQLSMAIAEPRGDPGRIAAQIVTGVGFIGAGTILHARGAVTGLTSAATIWVVAAIGVALGSQAYIEATGVTLLLIFVLRGLRWMEGYVGRQAVDSVLSVEVPREDGRLEEVEQILRESGLELHDLHTEATSENRMLIHANVRGNRRRHDDARLALLRKTGSFRLSIDE
jgi:putative Mg2+ transporter-C (MgtC) family protein